jgi:hypothetical protein
MSLVSDTRKPPVWRASPSRLACGSERMMSSIRSRFLSSWPDAALPMVAASLICAEEVRSRRVSLEALVVRRPAASAV